MKKILHIAVLLIAIALAAGCKQACKDVACMNNGECSNSTGSCSCIGRWGGLYCDSFCTLGYEGTYCNIVSRTKFIRTWSATTTSVANGTVNNLLYITAGTTIEKIIITNFNNENYSMIGTMSGKNTFDIVTQNATGAFTGTVSGSGHLNGDKITIDLNKAGVNYFASCNK